MLRMRLNAHHLGETVMNLHRRCLQTLPASLAWMIAALFATACMYSRPIVTVPKQESAQAQYRKAVETRANMRLALMRNEKKYRRGRDIARQTMEKVPEYFPDDRRWTPLARLDVIELSAGLDSPRVDPSRRQIQSAVEQLRNLADAYPEFEFIQAKTRYDEGLCLNLLKNYPEAKGRFLELRELFKDHTDPQIQDLVKKANYYRRSTTYSFIT